MDKKVISLLKTQCFIDGQWVGKPEISVTNKATGEEIAKVPRLGATETKQAIDAAAKAFVAWSRLLAKERSNIMRRWFDLQIQHADELALLLTSEQGKPLAEAKGVMAPMTPRGCLMTTMRLPCLKCGIVSPVMRLASSA